ncbi:hypothetical protein [Anaeromyxobacter sp. K]|uniref:hypothetical protein n=1 Tax=Anaeromyxobacter sp. (strain K) TaxID=447217 RepID=UPI00059B869A|nr:hypothetical protein [Anaeromyxobacter sp. K]
MTPFFTVTLDFLGTSAIGTATHIDPRSVSSRRKLYGAPSTRSTTVPVMVATGPARRRGGAAAGEVYEAGSRSTEFLAHHFSELFLTTNRRMA